MIKIINKLISLQNKGVKLRKAIWKVSQISLGFSNILGEAEINTIPKTWEKWISIVQEKYEKTQTSEIYWFLKYFRLSKNL